MSELHLCSYNNLVGSDVNIIIAGDFDADLSLIHDTNSLKCLLGFMSH